MRNHTTVNPLDVTVFMVSTMFLPSIGGVENHVYYLSRALMEIGYKVIVLNPRMDIPTSRVQMMDGLEVHVMKVGDKARERKYKELKSAGGGGVIGLFNGYRRKAFLNQFKKEIFEYIENLIESRKTRFFVIHQHDFILNP